MSKDNKEDSIGYRILIAIADGCCEAETLVFKTILNGFGSDVQVLLASCSGNRNVKMKGGLELKSDLLVEEVKFRCDLLLLPDGDEKAMQQLKENAFLSSLIKRQRRSRRLLAASGRTPALILRDLLPQGSTCYPLSKLRKTIPCATDNDVVIAAGVATSQGLGTSMVFAVQLGECLFGKVHANNMAKACLIDRSGSLGMRYLVEQYQRPTDDDDETNQSIGDNESVNVRGRDVHEQRVVRESEGQKKKICEDIKNEPNDGFIQEPEDVYSSEEFEFDETKEDKYHDDDEDSASEIQALERHKSGPDNMPFASSEENAVAETAAHARVADLLTTGTSESVGFYKSRVVHDSRDRRKRSQRKRRVFQRSVQQQPVSADEAGSEAGEWEEVAEKPVKRQPVGRPANAKRKARAKNEEAVKLEKRIPELTENDCYFFRQTVAKVIQDRELSRVLKGAAGLMTESEMKTVLNQVCANPAFHEENMEQAMLVFNHCISIRKEGLEVDRQTILQDARRAAAGQPPLSPSKKRSRVSVYPGPSSPGLNVARRISCLRRSGSLNGIKPLQLELSESRVLADEKNGSRSHEESAQFPQRAIPSGGDGENSAELDRSRPLGSVAQSCERPGLHEPLLRNDTANRPASQEPIPDKPRSQVGSSVIRCEVINIEESLQSMMHYNGT